MIILVVTGAAQAQSPTFKQVDFPLGPQAGATSLIGINNSGVIVGSFRRYSTGLTTSFAAKPPYTSFAEIAVPGAISTSVIGIDDAGQICGTYTVPGIPSNATFGFVREIAGSKWAYFSVQYASEPVSFIDTAHLVSFAVGLNGVPVSNEHINYDLSTGYPKIFTIPIIQNPQGSLTTVGYAKSFNHSGLVVGMIPDPIVANRSTGFVWQLGSATSPTTVSGPDAVVTSLNGVNNRGQGVGSFATASGLVQGSFHGFVVDTVGGSSKILDVAGSDVSTTTLTAVNDAGEIAGTFSDKAGFHGVVISGVKPNFTK